ncbi:hypothetical protein [Lapidilactobacillus bayanensis]|uniref:hypothetical protein n=1 Tax=Lapidilactobacillus bayanensis TaxID=2485998 RepID=UPI000F7995C6|nr:hypothetical protein [Lapidilactobacillus bayanensis]
MKINAKVEDGLLTGWGYASDERAVGEEHNGLTVYEVNDTSQLVGGHTHLINGVFVLDSDYQEPEPPQQQEPSPAEQVTALKQQNDELQSALLELSDILLSGGLS